jgi:hypothetical protein
MVSMVKRVEVQGAPRLMARFAAKARDPKRRDVRASVGYTAPYAIYVHERLDVYHPNGQAKFLTTAARRVQRKMSKLVVDLMRKGLPLRSAVLQSAILLLDESRRLVPVDTGRLWKSGYAKTEYI